jgi:hypothetical protein
MTENYFEEWLNEYGDITSFSYMIFGHFGIRDNATINMGLTMRVMQLPETTRFGQSIEDVDEEMAEVFGVTRGTNVQWIFPGKLPKETQRVIIEMISEGLDHLNIKYEFFGILGDLHAN